jgi:NADPH:quinone reductase
MMRTMRAIVVTELGGPEVLKSQEVPLNWPRGARDVLVRLRAASLNPADIYFRRLGPYVRSDAPLILGHDGAGEIEAVGSRVTRFKPGDAVCFCNGGIGGDPGTYADFAVVPESQLVPKAPSVDFVQAAALPLVAITLWESLYDRARLRRGERVLVHAGAGGTGHIGIQLARLAGAQVATTVSSEAKAALAAELGAELVIRYREQDFATAISGWTKGRGLDVAVDNVGAEVMQRTFSVMAPYGRVVTLMGTPADTSDGAAYNGNLTVHNVMMLTPMWLGLKARLRQQADRAHKVMNLVAKGNLRVVVDKVFPLSEAVAAHRYLESGQAVGKVVLAM